jgi:hypothetical protein
VNASALVRVWALAWACALGCLALPGFAWSTSGHMQIASFAYDALSEAERAQWVRLLRAHPRFAEDFASKLPPELHTDAERARWLFLWAAVWPDLAKGQPAYERGHWHYVNLPLSLRAGTLATCAQARAALPESQRRAAAERAARQHTQRQHTQGQLTQQQLAQQQLAQQQSAEASAARPSASQDGASAALTPTEPEEIRTAFAWARRTLGDTARPATERALALAWLLHLVGDAHQPLHAVALFTQRRFVFGDRGGNEILAGTLSLHRVWDSLLGDDVSLPFVQQRARGWLARAELRKDASAARSQLEIDAWLDEDCELARRSVYTRPILRVLESAEGGALLAKPEVALDAAYLAGARRAAERRAAMAGARLAAILKSLSQLPTSVP